MSRRSVPLIRSALVFAMLAVGQPWTRHAASAADAPPPDTAAWNGAVNVYGTVRGMMHEGKTGAAISLSTILPNPRLYGIGALTELAGEVTIMGGTAYLSHPETEGSARTSAASESDAGAALLVTAEVPSWQRIVIERPIPFERLDDEIEALAASAGLDLTTRIPFLLEGRFEGLQWHVVDGRRLAAGSASHQDHLAAAVQETRAEAAARLVGFYSRGDAGIFTHLGSKTHIHCVLEEPLSAGHVDRVTIPPGTIVLFPARGESGSGVTPDEP